MLSNILNIYCKNIFTNFLIAESCRIRTHLFQKLLSPAPAPAPESRNTPVLHRQLVGYLQISVRISHANQKQAKRVIRESMPSLIRSDPESQARLKLVSNQPSTGILGLSRTTIQNNSFQNHLHSTEQTGRFL